MATTYQLLQKAERLELLAQQLYTVLASRFGGNAKAVFQRLAEEEAQHAARVKLLAARFRGNPKLAATLTADAGRLDVLIAEAGAAIAAASEGRWDGQPETALQRACDLEDRFAAAHAQVLAKDAQPELRAFFDQLAAQDRAHQALLKG
jgi:rubrerythrin